MSDKILSRERFLVEINQSIAEQRCTTPLDLHDAALRADRDTWKAQAEAQRDAVQGLLDALTDCLDVIEPIRDEMYKQGAAEHDPIRLDAGKCCDEVLAFARASLKAWEEAKAK